MIGALREWLTSVVMVSMLLTAAQTLTPEGSIRKITSFIGGLILLAALLQPLLRSESLDLDLTEYRQDIQTQQALLEQMQAEELQTRIEAQTGAYILDKASALGMTVTVQVETQIGQEGIPIPWAVTIQGPKSETLADWLERELGIPKERQEWNESEC